MFLSDAENEQLNKIKEAVVSDIGIDELLLLISEIKAVLADQNFAYTYAGCLLANRNRIDDAMEMFRLNEQDIFCSIMVGYLDEYGVFDPAGKVFKSALPYDIYSRTDFFQIHQAKAILNIKEIIKHVPPPISDTSVTIIDIGPGNGSLITKIVNEIILLYNIKSVRLVLVDPFEEMLSKASEYCKQNITVETEIVNVCCKIQNITREQVELINQAKPIWFVNAALSIHHMPWEQKIPMLKQLKEFSPHLILTEVDWNHDLPEKDAPELIYSVAKSYGIFCKDIFKLPVSEKDKKLCLYLFPMSEAINIIKQERPNRIDFHTPITEWKKIAKKAGWETGEAMPTYMVDGKPFAFVMGFEAAKA